MTIYNPLSAGPFKDSLIYGCMWVKWMQKERIATNTNLFGTADGVVRIRKVWGSYDEFSYMQYIDLDTALWIGSVWYFDPRVIPTLHPLYVLWTLALILVPMYELVDCDDHLRERKKYNTYLLWEVWYIMKKSTLWICEEECTAKMICIIYKL